MTVYVELPESPVNEDIGKLTIQTNISFINTLVIIFCSLSIKTIKFWLNFILGMFMLCVRMSDKYGYLVSSSCRSSRLRYKSQLYRVIHTLFMVPFYLTGLSSEKQLIQLEMYTDFEEDQVLIYLHIVGHSFALIFYYIL